MPQPTVISFVGTFLKREMQHIYRQVTGLKRYRTCVLTQERLNAELFPFDPVEVVGAAKIGLIERARLKYLERTEPLVYRGEFNALTKAVAKVDADLMHVYFGHTGVHLLPFIKRWNRPVVVSFHGMDVMPREENPRYLERLRELLWTAPIVLARSESLRNALVERGGDAARIRINRTSVPLDQYPFVKRTPPQDGAWAFVQACRFIEKKGLDDTLRAFALFRDKFPKARLHLAGGGPLEKQLRELALKLNIHPVFHGFLDQHELAALYASAHAFIHPSRVTETEDQEGVPNAMLEAMATGLPVIATRHGGIPEVVRNEVSGLLSPEGDWRDLGESMLKLTTSPELYQRYSGNASQTVRAEFDPEVQIRRLEAAYDEAIERFTKASG